MKAQEYVQLGYQKLVTFESPTGGFNWWGNSEPGNKLLTGFGIQQLEDMAGVCEVDRAIVDRARRWLAESQRADGSWEPTEHLHGYNRELGAGALRATAYVLWSLLQAGDSGPHIQRAVDYLAAHQAEAEKDPYSLALVANALVLADKGSPLSRAVLRKLHAARTEQQKDGKTSVFWQCPGRTAMYARGQSASVETTALAVLALMASGEFGQSVNQALSWLVAAKGPQGDWGSTQATILTFKALLQAASGGVGEDADMSVAVRLDGKEVAREVFNPDNSDVMRLIDLGVVASGKHRVEIAPAGKANVMYQIVGRCSVPWRRPEPSAEPLAIELRYDRSRLAVDDVLSADVEVVYRPAKPTFMVIVELGIPPGFELIPDLIEGLVESGTIKRYTAAGQMLTLYVGEMSQERKLAFRYQMRAKYPVKVQSPRSLAYEYYTPDSRAVQMPQPLEVVAR